MNPFIAPLINIVDSALERVIPDVNERKRMAHEIATKSGDQAQEIMLGQLEVNAIEAKSDKWWKAGWRPFIGWAGGLAMFNNYLLLPYATALSDKIQPMDLTQLLPVVLGMLGLGTMRSFEKNRGVD